MTITAEAPNAPTPETDDRSHDSAETSSSFADFALPKPLLETLRRTGIESPFPIQTATLPDALAGRDVLGRAQTGSGKTLAFGLALLTRLHQARQRDGRPGKRSPRGLVLVPTRELAMQVSEALQPLGKAAGLHCATIVGGMSFQRQSLALERGADLVIATPGRLADHTRQGTCSLSEVAFVTLDEADQMADMGFLPQVTEILRMTPSDGQRMLFSASLDGEVATLVRDHLSNPREHSVAPATAGVTTMEHHVFTVEQRDKHAVTSQIAARDGRTIMFVRTKHHADRVAEKLRSDGVPAVALHGGKTQGQRNRVLAAFRAGAATTLVATDVAARGIHVDNVSLVLHIDPPGDAKDYLHRAGRTARAGESGTVATLVTPQQRRAARRIISGAGVQPKAASVQPGDTTLASVTGARRPTGTAVPEPQVEQSGRSRPKPGRGVDGRGHGGHGGKDRRDTRHSRGRNNRSGERARR
ncbi:DEAD/DEAH box helicase [Haloechinothrix alba]|uniref:DEAD/DEAH box helicase n=1 Tax=Haloechinothrix alba TaxID=664784 RepID=UPI001FE6A18A|nr:DEAD/DEAH box helicase [Haloechinothrix alba]